MASVPISHVTPDFESLYDALKRKLERKGTWVDTLPTSVGTTLLDLFAGATVSNQFYLDMSLREAFLPLAVRDSSIFAGTRMLGVQISRKTCASCVVELTNYATRTKYIPPYSQFELDGRMFFNRSQYMIPPGTTIETVDLFSGQVKEQTFTLSSYGSLALREFVLNEPGFVVSAVDVLAYTKNKSTGNIQIWDPTDKAIFEHGPNDAVYFDSTHRGGDMSLFFGDGEYGQILDPDDVLHVRYVVTDGADGNKGLPGIKVRLVSDSEVKGETITSIAGGADQKSALYYKLFGGNMFRTKRRAISGSDIRATIMNYPGIADATIMGQREIAPNDPRWMNSVRVCVLPEEQDTFGGANPNPKSSQWRQFIDWLTPMMHDAYANGVQTWNPEKVYVNVRIKIAILPSAKEQEIRIVALENILKIFQKKPGILGRRLSQSDISNAVKKIEGVDYVQVTSPEEDITMPDRLHYCVLDGAPILDVVYSERTLGVKGDY